MTVREFWQVLFSRTVILLSLIFGSMVGILMVLPLYVYGDPTYLYHLAIAVVPIAVNVLAGLMISGYVALRFRYAGQRFSPTAPATILASPFFFIASMVPGALINIGKYMAGGLEFNGVVFVLLVTPFIYVLVSDYLFYVVFEYVAPSILGRAHVPVARGNGPTNQYTAAPQGVADTQPEPGVWRWLFFKGLAAPTQKPQKHSADNRCLSIWISGHHSSLMSIRELWRVVFSKTVMAMSVSFGAAVGISAAVILRAVGDETYYVLLLFVFAPVLVNIVSSGVMTAAVLLKRGRGNGRQANGTVIVFPSALTVLLAAIVVIAPIYVLKLGESEIDGGRMILVLMVLLTLHIIISEFFHYIIFKYITPSIWGRQHIYQKDRHAALRPAPNADEASAAPVDQEPSVRIGDTVVQRASVLFLEAQANYLRIVTKEQEFLERFRISEAAEVLGADFGVFVHRSYWVAYSGIQKVDSIGGRQTITMLNGDTLTVAASRGKAVMAAFALNNVHVIKSARRAPAR